MTEVFSLGFLQNDSNISKNLTKYNCNNKCKKSVFKAVLIQTSALTCLKTTSCERKNLVVALFKRVFLVFPWSFFYYNPQVLRSSGNDGSTAGWLTWGRAQCLWRRHAGLFSTFSSAPADASATPLTNHILPFSRVWMFPVTVVAIKETITKKTAATSAVLSQVSPQNLQTPLCAASGLRHQVKLPKRPFRDICRHLEPLILIVFASDGSKHHRLICRRAGGSGMRHIPSEQIQTRPFPHSHSATTQQGACTTNTHTVQTNWNIRAT